jgi:hypothetical protein
MRAPIDFDYVSKTIVGIASPVLGVTTSYSPAVIAAWQALFADPLLPVAGIHISPARPADHRRIEVLELVDCIRAELLLISQR